MGTVIPEAAFWFIPAGKIYYYIGMFSDIKSYFMMGRALNPDMVKLYMKAYLLGVTTGITRKTIRRKFRRGISGWK